MCPAEQCVIVCVRMVLFFFFFLTVKSCKQNSPPEGGEMLARQIPQVESDVTPCRCPRLRPGLSPPHRGGVRWHRRAGPLEWQGYVIFSAVGPGVWPPRASTALCEGGDNSVSCSRPSHGGTEPARSQRAPPSPSAGAGAPESPSPHRVSTELWGHQLFP